MHSCAFITDTTQKNATLALLENNNGSLSELGTKVDMQPLNGTNCEASTQILFILISDGFAIRTFLVGLQRVNGRAGSGCTYLPPTLAVDWANARGCQQAWFFYANPDYMTKKVALARGHLIKIGFSIFVTHIVIFVKI